MTLFVHLLRTDLRRLRLLLLAWIVVVAAATVLDGVRPRLASMRVQEALGIVGSLTGLAKLLLMFLIVPFTIQLHPLVGSDAFWMTRPIPPRVLLAVKTMLLWVVIVLIPAVASAILMAAYRVPPGTVALVSVESMLSQTLLLTVLMCGAAVTPNMARFALLVGSVLLAMAAVIAVSLAIAMSTVDFDRPGSGGGLPDETGGLVFTGLAIGAAVLLLCVQYGRRSRVRALSAGLGALAVAAAVSASWPWPLLAMPFEPPGWARNAAAVELSADPSTVEVAPEMPSFTSQRVWRSISAVVGVDSTAPTWSAHPSVADAALLVGGRVVLRTPGRGGSASLSSPGQSESTNRIAMQLLGVRTLTGASRIADTRLTVLFVPDEDVVRVAPMSGRYEGRFHVLLTKHEVEAVLPLRSGAVHRNGPYGISVEGLTRSSSSVTVFTCESRASSAFERRPHSQYQFYLRNRRTAEGVAGGRQYVHFNPLGSLLPFGISVYAGPSARGFTPQPHLVRFPASRGPDADPPPALTDGWLAEAELVIVRSTWDGFVERSLVIEPFTLDAGHAGNGPPARRP